MKRSQDNKQRSSKKKRKSLTLSLHSRHLKELENKNAMQLCLFYNPPVESTENISKLEYVFTQIQCSYYFTTNVLPGNSNILPSEVQTEEEKYVQMELLFSVFTTDYFSGICFLLQLS